MHGFSVNLLGDTGVEITIKHQKPITSLVILQTLKIQYSDGDTMECEGYYMKVLQK